MGGWVWVFGEEVGGLVVGFGSVALGGWVGVGEIRADGLGWIGLGGWLSV